MRNFVKEEYRFSINTRNIQPVIVMSVYVIRKLTSFGECGLSHKLNHVSYLYWLESLFLILVPQH